jgi:UDP-3-O-[3-hydroxymyristoyl] glucosamine N-acyltransferase
MKTLGEIARLIEGDLKGPENFSVSGIQALIAASPDEISFAVSKRYKEQVKNSRAGALILPKNWPYMLDRPSILVNDPYLAYAILASAFLAKPFSPLGISPGACVGSDCEIDSDVSIYPGVFIGDRVRIGAHVQLFPGVYVGNDVYIESETTLYPNVNIYAGCRLGKRVIVHAGTVIGSDGFGYARQGESHIKIPHTGIVVIEDDVEIGANCAIDRAAFGETRIGRGTKIDNLVQIAHNVSVGANSLLVAQTGISGSTCLGNGVVLGGQVGLVGHIELGNRVMVGAKSGVAKSVANGEVVSGSPAMPHRLWLRVMSALKHLPEMAREVRELKVRMDKIEDRSLGKGRNENNA